eukprot:CAMPEP_0181218420 /NCGR_PEP_ID=MMETSP1096-20121128/27688_1 /TAXON_ID=156174 ORGANISM="Chrysochromulina ericina, Strain CCMP281" /NCGR_SAMPLE_ID=MMETSP1096 /ASSEMBLY_ACC=CAM_ASM_000453 /LENGTH=127 /DNA_ID=CAMNT_0023310643 /DNA_START=114 /DNA_END=497 /DNA_ORIENTATION=-
MVLHTDRVGVGWTAVAHAWGSGFAEPEFAVAISLEPLAPCIASCIERLEKMGEWCPPLRDASALMSRTSRAMQSSSASSTPAKAISHAPIASSVSAQTGHGASFGGGGSATWPCSVRSSSCGQAVAS